MNTYLSLILLTLAACSNTDSTTPPPVDGPKEDGGTLDAGTTPQVDAGTKETGSVSDAAVGACGDVSSAQAFFGSNARTLATMVAATGGTMTPLFTGTYAVVIQATGTLYIEQVTPSRSAPYNGFAWRYTSPPDTFMDEPNEVNVLLDSGAYKGVLQCEKATGQFTLVASEKGNPAVFVRLQGK